jgi:hypothetical protein
MQIAIGCTGRRPRRKRTETETAVGESSRRGGFVPGNETERATPFSETSERQKMPDTGLSGLQQSPLSVLVHQRISNVKGFTLAGMGSDVSPW